MAAQGWAKPAAQYLVAEIAFIAGAILLTQQIV
jgi:hypothetical protein